MAGLSVFGTKFSVRHSSNKNILHRLEEGEDFRTQPNDEWPQQGEEAPSPYILYGPHGYQTYPHSRCQEVPTVDVDINEIQGDWFLQEYVNSHDGKPIGPNQPYLCPESRMSITPNMSGKEGNHQANYKIIIIIT